MNHDNITDVFFLVQKKSKHLSFLAQSRKIYDTIISIVTSQISHTERVKTKQNLYYGDFELKNPIYIFKNIYIIDKLHPNIEQIL